MTSLSPVHTIGAQIVEAIRLHIESDKKKAKELALDMINRVGISNPAQRLDEYPHQLSGGMRQRAMIAMALSCSPSLLIADEPTTALDVTVQAQILELMKELQAQFGMAIMYITHDLGVIAEIADEVNVMYLGRVVERLRRWSYSKPAASLYAAAAQVDSAIGRPGARSPGCHPRQCARADESATAMWFCLALR